jgi:thymidylate synthase
MTATADQAFALALADHDRGHRVQTRNGERIYLGPRLLSYNPLEARITSRPINDKFVAAELIWMLSGRCDTSDYLHAHNLHIWDKWLKPDGTFGPIYGAQWRGLEDGIDQVKLALERLVLNAGDTQAMVTAWNPAAIADMALPPCHFAHQPVLYPFDEGFALDLHVFQRSCDVLIGLPYNMAFYGLLLQFYARALSLLAPYPVGAGTVHHHISHAHIYSVHLDVPGVSAWLDIATDPAHLRTPEWWIPPESPAILELLDYQPPAPKALTQYAEPIEPATTLRLEAIA